MQYTNQRPGVRKNDIWGHRHRPCALGGIFDGCSCEIAQHGCRTDVDAMLSSQICQIGLLLAKTASGLFSPTMCFDTSSKAAF